jgi:HD-GYP domain-containing protein (c-di-GMP phosphodiesterase class II)
MLKKINAEKLRVGMYVNLPFAWYKHSFIKNNFTIVSEAQISKIKNIGLEDITIDTDRGDDISADPAPIAARAKEPAVQIVPDKLLEAIHDKNLPAPEKAIIIHEQATEMMQRLLDNPSATNIQAVKKGIAEVVDLILHDDATTQQLLLITSHDFYTFTHSVTVGVLGVSLSKTLFKTSDGHDMHELGSGFFLHDVGKIEIDQAILNKPGRLTEEEMQEIRRHPALGFKILHSTGQLTEECKLIVLEHHERYEGRGYPKGMRGDDIHLYGRICIIADVYDALTSDRPYRKKMAPFTALRLMQTEMLGHFDKELFEKFVMIFR